MARIFVVEDEHIVAMDIRVRLERMGHEVVCTAMSRDTALQCMAEHSPDLVLMDVFLNGTMDGVQAADEIRRTYGIPVVYLTACSDPETISRAKMTEPFGYVLKPYTDQEIRAAIEMALYKHSMECKLRDNERWLSATLRSLGDAVIATDGEGHVRLMNDIAQQLTGLILDVAQGQSLHEVVPVFNEVTRMPVDLWQTLSLGDREKVCLVTRLVLPTRQGREIPVEATLAFIKDEHGKTEGMVLVIRDITERRSNEQQRRLIESRLQDIQKLESIGILAGGIAHDFNNLLMGIQGNAELALLELPPPSGARNYLHDIKSICQRASDLTQQLLAYAGQGKVLVEAMSLSTMIHDMSDLLRLVVVKKAEFQMNLADNLPSIEGDVSQLRQVVLNLVTNASESLKEDGGSVRISTGTCAVDEAYVASRYSKDPMPKGLYVFVRVEDTGCGMNAQIRDRMFEPFFTTKFMGRGMGLSAVLGIVGNHGGDIQVQSESGKGTKIEVLFPVQVAQGSPARRALTPVDDSVSLSGLILLVDDEHDVLNVTAKFLQLKGFKVLKARDGQEAVDLFRQHAADITVIVLDMAMPRMGGEETLTELRKIRPDVPVILSSGFPEQETLSQFPVSDRLGFIQKPYEFVTLMNRIQKMIVRAPA